MNKASKTFLAAAALALAPAAAHAVIANVNPSSVLIKMLEMRVSPNADCSNAVSVFLNASPVYQDFISNPTLGSGSIPLGTYNCLMIHISDQVKFSPVSTIPTACQAGTIYTWDTCHDAAYTHSVDDYYQNPDGTLVNCHGGNPPLSEDFPWIYFSTTGTQNPTIQTDSEAGYVPTPIHAFTLSSALVVASDKMLTFVYDFDGQVNIDGGSGLCSVGPPNIFFR